MPAEPVWLMAKLTRGYLQPLINGRIDLTFTAMGTCDGSTIALGPAAGKPFFAQQIRAATP